MDFLGCQTATGCIPFSEADKERDTVKVQVEFEKENASPNQRPRMDSRLAKAIDVGARVEAFFDSDWYAGTVLKIPDNDDRECRNFTIQCDIDENGIVTEAAEVRLLQGRCAGMPVLDEQLLHGLCRTPAETCCRDTELADQQAAAELACRLVAQAQELDEAQRLAAVEENRLASIDEDVDREEQELKESERHHEEECLRQAAEQKESDSAKLQKFLLKHGYCGVNRKRTKMLKSKYALHTAVKLTDRDMVSLLLATGADPQLKNSAGETPKKLAHRLNKDSSHGAVLAALP